MQRVSDEFEAALQGSVRPLMVVDAWYDGSPVMTDVPVSGGSVDLDTDRTIHGSLSLEAASSDDSLAPRSWDSPLAPFGSELQVRVGFQTSRGNEFVSLGWYRIDSSDPKEEWQFYDDPTDPDAPKLQAYKGTTVAVESADRMSHLDDARFLSPETPASLSSVQAEIVRIAGGIVPLASWAGVPDAAIPASIAYQTSRVQAIQDLAGVMGYKARMNANGQLTLVPVASTGDPVWTITVGSEGTAVNWSRKLDRSQLYNGVVASGTTAEGVAVVGIATEQDGPLRYGGPFGRVLYGHSSPLITSTSAAQADATTRLASLIRDRVVPVTVRCIAHPALELDDIVALELPDATLTGPVSSIQWPLPPTSMELTVMVPREQIWR